MTENLKKLLAFVDDAKDEILAAERWIWAHPETGYKEWQTTQYLEKKYEALGYVLHKAGDIPGFYTDVDTGRPGPTFLIFGEMDSVVCDAHPESNSETGAVHACGHNAQSAALYGIAAALARPGATDGMCGKIRLCAVPAEELIEIGYREGLRKKGVIHYFGGKVEYLYRGYFDDVDMCMLVHTSCGESGTVFVCGSENGCVAKVSTFVGRSAHAGGAPHEGINSLYAANIGIQAANALRETFCEKDHIRFHPIITRGGDAVNVIPPVTTVESYVRGATPEAIVRENKKINRALASGALALGGNMIYCDRPGYFPHYVYPELCDVMETALHEGGIPATFSKEHNSACSDMGDMSYVMPAVELNMAGAKGTPHGADYRIVDPVSACVTSAKAQLMIAYELLRDGAKNAQKVLDGTKPGYASKKEFLAVLDSLFADGEAIEYNEKGAEIRF